MTKIQKIALNTITLHDLKYEGLPEETDVEGFLTAYCKDTPRGSPTYKTTVKNADGEMVEQDRVVFLVIFKFLDITLYIPRQLNSLFLAWEEANEVIEPNSAKCGSCLLQVVMEEATTCSCCGAVVHNAASCRLLKPTEMGAPVLHLCSACHALDGVCAVKKLDLATRGGNREVGERIRCATEQKWQNLVAFGGAPYVVKSSSLNETSGFLFAPQIPKKLGSAHMAGREGTNPYFHLYKAAMRLSTGQVWYPGQSILLSNSGHTHTHTP